MEYFQKKARVLYASESPVGGEPAIPWRVLLWCYPAECSAVALDYYRYYYCENVRDRSPSTTLHLHLPALRSSLSRVGRSKVRNRATWEACSRSLVGGKYPGTACKLTVAG